MNVRLLAVLCVALGSTACATPTSAFSGMIASDERRIWVIRTRELNQEVFRCADIAEAGSAPQPVCIRAALGAATGAAP